MIEGISVYRTVFFVPSICAGIAILMVWRNMFNYEFGAINQGLRLVGLSDPPDWLQSLRWSKPALMIVALWGSVGGYNMVIYLAGLQNIPQQLYEAAAVDGAGALGQFRHVTWPMLAPTTFFILTMSMIGGFQGGFESAFMLTGGGPAGSTTTLAYYIYRTAYSGQLRLGYGSAIAWVLFLLVFAVTIVNWRRGGRGVTGS